MAEASVSQADVVANALGPPSKLAEISDLAIRTLSSKTALQPFQLSGEKKKIEKRITEGLTKLKQHLLVRCVAR
jgi:hypothetical protein